MFLVSRYRMVAFFTLLWIAVYSPPSMAAAAEVNIYSARKEALIKPLLDRFTSETGITVNLLTGKADALLRRLVVEGRNSPADLLITTDAGRLHRAKEAGVTRAIHSTIVEDRVPPAYRDPEGHWVGLSLRVRPILYVRDRVNARELSTYEALTGPRWRGRICIRSSGNIYNQSLTASLIAAHGKDATQAWADGLVANFARPPRGGDRDQIRAAAAGLCDIAVANTYYLVGMLTSGDPAQRRAAEALAVFWPNQQDRGAHVNISGVAVTRSARNHEAAIRLVEHLLSENSQAWYAETNGEYPVREGVATSAILQSWGPFKPDALNLARLGRHNAEAVRIMDRAGWR